MEYLLKASAVIFIFYIFYKLFLQRETFFQTNRIYLLIGLGTAILIPLIVIPVYIEYTPELIENNASIIMGNIDIQQNALDATFDFWQFTFLIYVLGLILFSGKLILELTSLKFLFNKHQYYKSGAYTLIETENNIPPFSFFNWIVYNPSKYSQEELQHILNHEKAHAKEFHSIDIMLTQLACVLFWFNPFVWLYKKEVQQNLEFIADKKAQDFSQCQKSYQLILLKSSVPKHKFLITNNFYNSQIKKRIIMLHKSKSNKLNALKYALILPALALFLMSYNTKEIFIEAESAEDLGNIPQVEASNQINSFYETVDSEKSTNLTNEEVAKVTKSNKEENKNLIAQATPRKVKKSSSYIGNVSITIIDKNTSDSELDKIKDNLKKEGLTFKFKGVKRNSKGEITAIKIEAKSENSSTSYRVDSDDEGIEPIKIVFDEEESSISIGNGHAKHGNNTFIYQTQDGGNHKIHTTKSGSNVYVISNDEHDHEEHENDQEHEHEAKVIVTSKGKKGKVKRIKKTKNVQVVSGDDNEVIEIIVDEDGNSAKETIVVTGKGKSKNVWLSKDGDEEEVIVNGQKVNITNGKGKNIWITKDNDNDDIIAIQNDDDKNNIFISNTGKDPLFIIDGKEVSKDKIQDINPNNIESVTVLKDKNAKEKYGEKGKNGVIIIKTKRN